MFLIKHAYKVNQRVRLSFYTVYILFILYSGLTKQWTGSFKTASEFSLASFWVDSTECAICMPLNVIVIIGIQKCLDAQVWYEVLNMLQLSLRQHLQFHTLLKAHFQCANQNTVWKHRDNVLMKAWFGCYKLRWRWKRVKERLHQGHLDTHPLMVTTGHNSPIRHDLLKLEPLNRLQFA